MAYARSGSPGASRCCARTSRCWSGNWPGLRTVDGNAPDITLTTNGSLLARKAQALKDAGLQRVTVSLDGLDDTVFRRMNDVDFPVAAVLEGIAAAHAAGLGPVKVNMVVKRGTNDHEILPMARHFRGSGSVLRFIEYMDVGSTNGWRMDEVLASADVVRRIHDRVAAGGAGSSGPWRDSTALGLCRCGWPPRPGPGRDRRDQQRDPGVLRRLQPCAAVDRRQTLPVPVCLRRPSTCAPCCARVPSDAAITSGTGAGLVSGRSDRYSELRSSLAEGSGVPRVEMSYIGG